MVRWYIPLQIAVFDVAFAYIATSYKKVNEDVPKYSANNSAWNVVNLNLATFQFCDNLKLLAEMPAHGLALLGLSYQLAAQQYGINSPIPL